MKFTFGLTWIEILNEQLLGRRPTRDDHLVLLEFVLVFFRELNSLLPKIIINLILFSHNIS